MYNRVVLIGRLVRDPEYRLTPSGVAVTKFTIAVDRFRKRDAQQENNADFIRIVTWRRLAEICHQYLKKGRLVAVEGRLQTDSYEKDGEKRYVTDVIADNMQMLERSDASPPPETGSSNVELSSMTAHPTQSADGNV